MNKIFVRSLEICDAFEYCPNMYQRKSIHVIVDNAEIETYDNVLYISISSVLHYFN